VRGHHQIWHTQQLAVRLRRLRFGHVQVGRENDAGFQGVDLSTTFTRDDLYRTLAAWVADKVYDGGVDSVLDDALLTDTSYDQLSGNSGADLFFISLGDKVTDLNAKKADGDTVVLL
jgi:hypothetical protein